MILRWQRRRTCFRLYCSKMNLERAAASRFPLGVWPGHTIVLMSFAINRYGPEELAIFVEVARNKVIGVLKFGR